MTRVALVFKKFAAYGGAERMAAALLDVFRGFGYDLTVIARDAPAAPEGVRVIRCDPFHLGRTGRVLGFARAVERLLGDLDADLVFSQEHMTCSDVYRAGGGAYAELLRQRHRVQSAPVRAYNRLHPYHRARLKLEKAMYESGRLRAVICNSPMVRDDILRHYDIAPERLHVIQNAIDVAAYRRPEGDPDDNDRRRDVRSAHGIPEEAPLFLFVGTGFQRKGLAVAIRALAEAGVPGHLLVVGKDKNLNGYRRLARRLGLASRVHFAGGRDDVRPYYWAADALVHPAFYEAFGLVVLEAMAAGLPVLASRQCGAAQALVSENENGFLADSLDVAAFARGLAALADVERRAPMAEVAAGTAAEHDLPTMRTQLETLFDRLLPR